MMLTEEQMQFVEKIANLKDFDETFELVKAVVLQKFKLHRAGLSLILQMMPSSLGAYHMLGSNAIVVNTYLLTTLKRIVKSTEEYNSYIFMVLSHEYLHSLGIVDENTVRQMTFELCKWMLGNDHTATKMAKNGPSAIYPELRSLMQSQFGKDFQVVKNFDRSNQTYIQ
ncbi:MAG: hypothetical protein M3M86_02385 [Thermoproteota archaeon]|jgi:hypothetical protein|nr:hypothetical protein [Thermoproteota archaeon]